MLDWTRSHLRPKGNVSSHKKHKSKVKLTAVHGVAKQQKIEVDYQMKDATSLDSASIVTIFK